MKMGKPIWVFDLDDTLADTSPRAHLHPRLVDDGPGWIPYSMACESDLPIFATIEMLNHSPFEVWIVTGRTELAREFTEKWLEEQDVDYDDMIMRADGDHRKNVEIKLASLEYFESINRQVVLWVDDYDAVCEAMELRGVSSMHFRPGMRPNDRW